MNKDVGIRSSHHAWGQQGEPSCETEVLAEMKAGSWDGVGWRGRVQLQVCSPGAVERGWQLMKKCIYHLRGAQSSGLKSALAVEEPDRAMISEGVLCLVNRGQHAVNDNKDRPNLTRRANGSTFSCTQMCCQT